MLGQISPWRSRGGRAGDKKVREHKRKRKVTRMEQGRRQQRQVQLRQAAEAGDRAAGSRAGCSLLSSRLHSPVHSPRGSDQPHQLPSLLSDTELPARVPEGAPQPWCLLRSCMRRRVVMRQLRGLQWRAPRGRRPWLSRAGCAGAGPTGRHGRKLLAGSPKEGEVAEDGSPQLARTGSRTKVTASAPTALALLTLPRNGSEC